MTKKSLRYYEVQGEYFIGKNKVERIETYITKEKNYLSGSCKDFIRYWVNCLFEVGGYKKALQHLKKQMVILSI